MPLAVDPRKVEKFLAAARAELARREGAITARFAKYENDPIGFIEDVLYGTLWSKQKEICRAIANYRRVAVPSCHDVGKSAIAARIVAWWQAVHPAGEAFVLTMAPTGKQVEAILWKEISKLHRSAGLPGRIGRTEWRIGKDIVALGRSPRDTDPTAIQGTRAKYTLVVLDEACGIHRELWPAADSLISNQFSRILAIGNPDDPDTEFHDVCKPGSGWHVINVSAFDSPNFTDEAVPDWLKGLLVSQLWEREKRKSWGVGSMRYLSKVLGQFPEESSDQLVPTKALTAALERGLDASIPTSATELGVDVARMGDDSTVIYARDGSLTWRYFKGRKHDTMRTVGHVMTAIRDLKPQAVKIDDIGLGGGVVDRLIELQGEGKIPGSCHIIGVNVGESPRTRLDDERFANLRAEMHWGMREKFVEGRITLIDDNDDAVSQASHIKYKHRSSGDIQIEPKADMKKRTNGVSPDDWDALVLCHITPHWSGEAFINMKPRQPPADPGADDDPRPWQPPSQKEKPEERGKNYLHQAYENAALALKPKLPPCKVCGKTVNGVSRMTDGVDVWHVPGQCPP